LLIARTAAEVHLTEK